MSLWSRSEGQSLGEVCRSRNVESLSVWMQSFFIYIFIPKSFTMLGLSNSAMRAASLWKSACMSAEASSLSIFTATIVKGSQGSKPGALWDIFLERNKKSGTFTYTQVISTHLHSYPCTYTAFPRTTQRKMPVIDCTKKYLTLVNENHWGYFQHQLTLKNAYLWIIVILKYMDPIVYYHYHPNLLLSGQNLNS